MIVKNKTEHNITVMIFGEEYTVEANSELKNVPEAVAEYWKKLHEFLVFQTEVATEEPKKLLLRNNKHDTTI